MDFASVSAWLETEWFWGMSAAEVLAAAATAMGIYLALTLLLRWAVAHADRKSGGGDAGAASLLAQVLAGTSRLLILLAALLVGTGMLDLPGRWHDRVSQLWFLAVAVQLGLWGTRAISLGVERYRRHHGAAGTGQISRPLRKCFSNASGTLSAKT